MSKICLEMEKVHKHFTRKEGKRKVKIHALNDVTFSAPKEKLTQDLIQIGTDVSSYWEEHYDV